MGSYHFIYYYNVYGSFIIKSYKTKAFQSKNYKGLSSYIWDCYDLDQILKYWNQSNKSIVQLVTISYTMELTLLTLAGLLTAAVLLIALVSVCLYCMFCLGRSPHNGHLEASAVDPEEPSAPVLEEHVVPSALITLEAATEVSPTAPLLTSPTAPQLASLEEVQRQHALSCLQAIASSGLELPVNCPVKSLYNFSYNK